MSHSKPQFFYWTERISILTHSSCFNSITHLRWDGAHFLHIAHHGYTFETNLAFFPLYPLLVRTLAIGLHWLQEDYAIISFVTSLKLSAVFLSNAFFILATEALYDLSRKVLKDEYLAYKAALFFAINPANIFFAAPYSESLNALLTFFTLYKISKQFSAVGSRNPLMPQGWTIV